MRVTMDNCIVASLLLSEYTLTLCLQQCQSLYMYSIPHFKMIADVIGCYFVHSTTHCARVRGNHRHHSQRLAIDNGYRKNSYNLSTAPFKREGEKYAVRSAWLDVNVCTEVCVCVCVSAHRKSYLIGK